LIKILEGLRDLGNTILVVEHDPDIMRSAGRILDMGPGAGEHGAESWPKDILRDFGAQDFADGRYLSGEFADPTSDGAAGAGRRKIQIYGATGTQTSEN